MEWISSNYVYANGEEKFKNVISKKILRAVQI
jgi:hypothetical protein